MSKEFYKYFSHARPPNNKKVATKTKSKQIYLTPKNARTDTYIRAKRKQNGAKQIFISKQSKRMRALIPVIYNQVRTARIVYTGWI